MYKKTLVKKPCEEVDDYAVLIPTSERFKGSSYLISSETVKFKNGDIGYLALSDGTINSLEYVRGDKQYKKPTTKELVRLYKDNSAILRAFEIFMKDRLKNHIENNRKDLLSLYDE